jgi:hypothetical protein
MSDLASQLLRDQVSCRDWWRELGPDGRRDMILTIEGCLQDPERLKKLGPRVARIVITLAAGRCAELVCGETAAMN